MSDREPSSGYVDEQGGRHSSPSAAMATDAANVVDQRTDRRTAETLTDEERDELAPPGELACVGDVGPKALRIIDGHVAERAALATRLEAAYGLLERVEETLESEGPFSKQLVLDIGECCANRSAPPTPTRADFVAQVAELTRERDEARALADAIETRANAEVARLAEALAAAKLLFDASDADRRREWQRAEAAEARVRDLEASIRGWADQLRGDDDGLAYQMDEALRG